MQYTLLLAAFTLLISCARLIGAEAQNLPRPWKHQDIGAVEQKGNASFDKGVFTIQGTLDTWGTNDGFHFVSQPVNGDVQIIARVLTVENTLNHAKAGVMLRETLAAGSRHAEAVVTPVDGTQFLARTDEFVQKGEIFSC